MRKLILIKHSRPEVVVDLPPEAWGLSEEGRGLCSALAERIGALEPRVILTSREKKAAETAELLGRALGREVRAVEGLHEHDRSNVPQLRSRDFISFMALFFRKPGERVLGRETAREALSRFEGAMEGILAAEPEGNLAVVTHGTVLALFAAKHAEVDPFALWRGMGLPSYLVFSLPEMKLEERVDRVAGEG